MEPQYLEYLETLPDNVLESEIIYQVSFPQIQQLCSSSRRLNRLCGKDSIWQKKTQIDFPADYAQKPVNTTWLSYYQQLVMQERQQRQRISRFLADLKSNHQILTLELSAPARQLWSKTGRAHIKQYMTDHPSADRALLYRAIIPDPDPMGIIRPTYDKFRDEVDYIFLLQHPEYIDQITAKYSGPTLEELGL